MSNWVVDPLIAETERYTFFYHPESDSYWVHEGELPEVAYNDMNVGLSNEVSKNEFLRGIRETGQENDFPEITKTRKEENNMTTTDNNTTKVITGKVRLSYVALLEPKAFEGQEPKYSTVILIPKEDKVTINKIRKAQKAAWEMAKNDKLKGVKFENVKHTLRDGDEEMDTEEHPEYAGHMFMSVSSKTRPGIIDKYKDTIDSADEVYSGVYARVSLNCFAYKTAGNKGVSAGLNNVQVIAKGESLAGRASADADFDEWADDEEDDDLL